jgi:hypothetical protein
VPIKEEEVRLVGYLKRKVPLLICTEHLANACSLFKAKQRPLTLVQQDGSAGQADVSCIPKTTAVSVTGESYQQGKCVSALCETYHATCK